MADIMTIYLPELTTDKSLFPDIKDALTEPDGLLAMGGDLSPERIINAYRNGIFPWFNDHQPILWWSPGERAIIRPADCHISKSMKKVLRKNQFTITLNHAFPAVISACAQPRKSQPDTWITRTMMNAYIALHNQGAAHSVEVWQQGKLVGGLYGVCVGTLFCGESMFSTVSNSSKVAFIALNQHLSHFQGALIDCQMPTDHLSSLGVKTFSRTAFFKSLKVCRKKHLDKACWSLQNLNVTTSMQEN